MVGSTHGAASRNRFAALLRVRLDFCNYLSCRLWSDEMLHEVPFFGNIPPMEFARITI